MRDFFCAWQEVDVFNSRITCFVVVVLIAMDLQAASLEAIYLANEGYLLKAADKSVVIDGLVTEPAWNYAVLPEKVYSAMLNAEPPFEHVNLLLASQ